MRNVFDLGVFVMALGFDFVFMTRLVRLAGICKLLPGLFASAALTIAALIFSIKCSKLFIMFPASRTSTLKGSYFHSLQNRTNETKDT